VRRIGSAGKEPEHNLDELPGFVIPPALETVESGVVNADFLRAVTQGKIQRFSVNLNALAESHAQRF
jgi:hypothetical protein